MFSRKSREEAQRKKQEEEVQKQRQLLEKEEKWRRVEFEKGQHIVNRALTKIPPLSFALLPGCPAPTRRNPELLLSGYLCLQSGRWCVCASVCCSFLVSFPRLAWQALPRYLLADSSTPPLPFPG